MTCLQIPRSLNVIGVFMLFSVPSKNGSVGQSLSALSAASLENVSAVCGLHSLSEAMLLFSLTLFRLVSSEHYTAPP